MASPVATLNAKPERPPNVSHHTSATVVFQGTEKDGDAQQSKSEGPESVKGVADNQILSGPNANADETSTSQVEAPSPATLLSRHIHDIFLLTGILVMLAWPWVFWGIVRSVGGVKMRNSHAKVVKEHPQSSAFFVSLIGNFVSLIVDVFFSLAVIRFAQEWVSDRPKVSVFHVSLLGAFRHQSFPWTMDDLRTLLRKNKWLPVALVGFCILSFQFVPSGTTSLLLPVPFNRTESLLGHELDFSSTAADCAAWLGAIGPFENDCDWKTYKNTSYTSCLGQNQLLDVLAAGRSSVLSLVPNNTESLALNQLGAKDGMHIIGPLRGILPLGPNGVPDFDTLEKSVFTNNDTVEAMLAYNYTLQYQGLSTNITCGFSSVTPIEYDRVPGDASEVPFTAMYNGNCSEGDNFLREQNVVDVIVPQSANGLGYWACRAPPTEGGLPSYLVYLQSQPGGGYVDAFGTIACRVSPIQFATYRVTYQSEARVFKSGERTSPASSVFLGLIEQALVGLVGVVKESQSSEANLVLEAVITAGVKNFGLNARGRDDRYLPLLERMIEGMLDYEAAYTRLIYSTYENPPASCRRNVPGEVTYTVFGWSGKLEHIGYLMPMTFLNLAALGIILTAIIISKPGILDLTDPTHPLHMMQTVTEDEGEREWGHSVSFRRSTAIQAALERGQERIALPSPDVMKDLGTSILA